MTSESVNKNIPLNPLMKIAAIPTFGIYDTSSYLLMQQIHIIKSQNIMPKNLPPYIILQIKSFCQKYPKIIPEFYHITLNGNGIYTQYNERIIETNLVRINLVAHPYIFNNSRFSKSAKTHINCAIFKPLDELDSIQESTEEPKGIKINTNLEIMDPQLNREITLIIDNQKNKILFEPNNCAFLLNLNNRIINFYCIVIGTHNNMPIKCFIGNYVIIVNGMDTLILNPLIQKLINYNNTKDLFLSLFLNQMLYNDSFLFIIFYILDKIVNKSKNKSWNINDIKDIFINGYKQFFGFEYDKNIISPKEHEEDLLNICNYYFNHIKNYINYLYQGSTFIEHFSENMLLCNIENKYIIEILRKYIDFHLSFFHNIIYSYFGYYAEEIDLKALKEEAMNIHKSKKWPKYKENYCKECKITSKEFDKIIMSFIDKNWKKIENKNIKLFGDIHESLMQGKEYSSFLEKIDAPIREYFFYYIWVMKGEVRGIHKNFGRYSFIGSDKIKTVYHCSRDEKIQCCEKIIQILTDADSQYNLPKDN